MHNGTQKQDEKFLHGITLIDGQLLVLWKDCNRQTVIKNKKWKSYKIKIVKWPQNETNNKCYN